MAIFDRKDDIVFVKWAKQVKLRDGFVCQVCDRRGVELNSHHLNSWDWCVEERFDLDNGITLCSNCHRQFHEMYGYGSNTRDQFEEFRQTSELLKDSIRRKIQVEIATKKILSDLEDGYGSVVQS